MSQSSRKVGFVSLGCPKALVDSEQIITQLRHEGYDIAPDYDGADLVVVNTCGFIDAAVEESLEAIGEALSENGKVIVTGCLGAKGDIVQETHPNVLAVTGPHAKDAVINAVHKHLPRQTDQPTIQVPDHGLKLTPEHYAYLKISEGCNHRCTFCIIPALRGDLVSRPIGDVMREAEALVESGSRELLVISQDTSAYGVDMKYRTDFWNGQPLKTRMTELANALGSLDVWVRLHYVYPYPHVDEVIPLMAEGRILPYLDMPLQHASPSILRSMKRPGNIDGTLERIQRWKQECPDLVLRSTFIVGFPGETEDDFEQLLEFINEAQLDRVGAFTYSDVEGASANTLPNHVPDEIKQERLARFMQLQAEISASKLQQRIGATMQIHIDESDGEQAIGRSYADAPEIDGQVFLEHAEGLLPGDMVDAVIVDADEHDMWAELEHDPELNHD